MEKTKSKDKKTDVDDIGDGIIISSALFKDMLDFVPDDRREDFSKRMKNSFMESGKACIIKAIKENIMTELEYDGFLEKGLTPSDFQPVLLAVFDRKKKNILKGEQVVILTSHDSSLFKNKSLLEKRFKIKIKSTKELMDNFKKIDPEKFKRIKDEIEQDQKEMDRMFG